MKKCLMTQITMVEHEHIITTYCSTGKLDREDAIKKYKDFNNSHPMYMIGLNVQGTAFHNILPIEKLNDFHIVRNLQLQLRYLRGKNLLEGLNNG